MSDEAGKEIVDPSLFMELVSKFSGDFLIAQRKVRATKSFFSGYLIHNIFKGYLTLVSAAFAQFEGDKEFSKLSHGILTRMQGINDDLEIDANKFIDKYKDKPDEPAESVH